MGLHQHLRFSSTAQKTVLDVLRGLSAVAQLDEHEGFLVFTQRTGEEFSFDCELTDDGIISDRAGDYFAFLGMFLEALTGEFGVVTVEDA
jgi:hypothetical protein